MKSNSQKRGLLGLPFFVLIFCLGCQSPYEGHSRIGPGLYRHYAAMGQGDLPIGDAVFIQLHTSLSLQREKGKYYEMEYGFRQVDTASLGTMALAKDLLGLVAGDSISYIFPYVQFKASVLDEFASDDYMLPDTTMIQLCIRVEQVYDQLSFSNLMERQEETKGRQEENDFLKKHLAEENLLADCKQLGEVYMHVTEEGQGDFIASGDEIALDFQTCFLNGISIDTSQSQMKRLYFQVGKPDQVVPAISMCLPKLKENGRARIYSPSHKAFGQRGNTTGLVPGYTPLYFDVHVVKIFRDSLDDQAFMSGGQ